MPPTPPPAVLAQFDTDSLDGLEDLKRLKFDIERMKAFSDADFRLQEFKLEKEFRFDPKLPELKFQLDSLQWEPAIAAAKAAQDAFLFAQGKPPIPPSAPAPAAAPRPKFDFGRGRESEDRMYRRGSQHLDRREWQNAADTFAEVASAGGQRVDGALYWKAYSLNKLGRRDDALAALAELRKSHPNSRWLNDAKALEAEVRQASGQAVSPERETDEDLKIFAINSLMHSDPERAVPLLQKILTSSASPKLKERALFVLAQSNLSQATEVVLKVAKGEGNPDIQAKAVEYIGIHGGAENRKVLSSIYASSPDTPVRRQILRAFMVSGDREALLRVAKSEPNVDLRREAINALGSMNAESELTQLYGSEAAPEIREQIIHAIASTNRSDRLLDLAKAEKDARLRRTVIDRLGHSRRNAQTAEALVGLYGNEQDKSVKQAIVQALHHQGNGKAMVDIARKESDPQLKREIVQRLSAMKSPEGTDYFMELLNK